MGCDLQHVLLISVPFILLFQEILGDICSYQTNDYDAWLNRYTTSTRYKFCTYGCCGGNYLDQDCCSVPISVIIGCSVGAVFFLAAVIFVCCCCVCCRTTQRNGQVIRGPSVVFHTASVTNINNNQHTVQQPVLNDPNAPPPSYDEVMSGQDNYAFK